MDSIEFLGMKISNGTYVPQPYIATHLQDFPDENLTVKQVQQFLGIVIYVFEFVPRLSKLTQTLNQMLKKNPLSQTKAQTSSIKQLKAIIPKLPSLKIPSAATKILQTDTSNDFWSIILLEETLGTRHVCGYKSGHFKPTEQNYHSTFKEILAVKCGIELFEFYLSGYHFIVELDVTFFPSMLLPEVKKLPHPQLVRCNQWFSN